MRRWVTRAALAGLLCAALPLAGGLPSASATSTSCSSLGSVLNANLDLIRTPMSYGGVANLTGYDAVLGGDVLVGLSQVSIITCGTSATPEWPRIGERFYLLMETDAKAGPTFTAEIMHTIRLPAGIYPAIDPATNNTAGCWLNNGSYNTPVPCNVGVDTGVNTPGWNGSFSWYLNSTTYSFTTPLLGSGISVPPPDYFYSILPVVAVRPIAPNVQQSDGIWGGAWARFPGGGLNGYGFSGAWLGVDDRTPDLGYPADAVSAKSATSASLKGTVCNYWKAGSATVQFGTTTSYGRETAADTIPGNNPAYPCYTTDPLPATGLTAGTLYHYRVKFAVSGGSTYYGPDATFTTDAAPPPNATVPGPPRSVGATPGDQQATVSWVVPASNGGDAITGYTATASPGGLTCSTTGLSCSVSGLANGQAYTFTVRATNGKGTGAASAASAAVVPRGLPGAPGGVTAQTGNTSARVSWAAAPANGAAIVEYVVTSSPGGKQCTTAGALFCTVSQLTNGQPYTFTVRARNAVGQGPASSLSNTVTPAAVPSAPGRPTALSGNRSIRMSWAAAASATAVTGYSVTLVPGGRTCATTGGLTCTITGLTNGVGYVATVRATNGVGAGPSSLPSARSVPSTLPTAPRTLRAAFPRALRTVLTWAVPASNGGAAITRYEYRSKLATARAWPAWRRGGVVRSATIVGLRKGVRYDVQVRAVNLRGGSAPVGARIRPTR